VTEKRHFVIGIDGGGTKSTALMVGMDGTVLTECTGGPTQIQVVGLKQASIELFELIKECCNKTGSKSDSIESVTMGVAGAGRVSDRVDLTNAILSLGLKKKFPIKNLRVETDAQIALEASFAGGPGICVIAGTGSIALYRTEDGKVLRTGGWGRMLGDEGSGYIIARDALNAIMRQYDKRGEKTDLTKKAMAHFSVSSPEDLIIKVYKENADIATFVPRVFEAAIEFDRIAHAILVKNANELVELVRILIMQSRPKIKLPVALRGGLLETDTIYSKMVKDKIVSSLPNLVVQKPKFPNAFGAAIIGLNAFK
jgi:N-acetylglucosamine kinase-like BadF-type ATPase